MCAELLWGTQRLPGQLSGLCVLSGKLTSDAFCLSFSSSALRWLRASHEGRSDLMWLSCRAAWSGCASTAVCAGHVTGAHPQQIPVSEKAALKPLPLSLEYNKKNNNCVFKSND